MSAPQSCLTQKLGSFAELRRLAQSRGPKRVAVVTADDDVALTAAAEALEGGIATPILIGDATKIFCKGETLDLRELLSNAEIVHAPDSAASVAIELARTGKADILLKGHLRTDELLHAVLDKANGLGTSRLLSDVMIYEDLLAGERRLVGMSDGGVNVAPTLEQKRQIIHNAIDVVQSLGIVRPKIALMSATEMVTKSLPSTVDARSLTEMAASGEFGDAEVFGPLALDNALLESAARAKGITSPVAGHADCLIVPNIEAGNLLGKAMKYLGGSQCGHVVVGAKVPILIPSRVESAGDKLNSIAMGVLFATR